MLVLHLEDLHRLNKLILNLLILPLLYLLLNKVPPFLHTRPRQKVHMRLFISQVLNCEVIVDLHIHLYWFFLIDFGANVSELASVLCKFYFFGLVGDFIVFFLNYLFDVFSLFVVHAELLVGFFYYFLIESLVEVAFFYLFREISIYGFH